MPRCATDALLRVPLSLLIFICLARMGFRVCLLFTVIFHSLLLRTDLKLLGSPTTDSA